MNVAGREVQHVIHLGIDREPVLSVYLVAPGSEVRKQVLLAALLDAQVRYVLAVGFYDLEVTVIHPDATLKIPLVLLDLLGGDVEDVVADLVDALLADIQD